MGTVLLLGSALIMFSVGIHYRCLVWLSDLHRKLSSTKKWSINLLIVGALLTHVLEMIIFSTGYAWLCSTGRYGMIQDSLGERSSDYFYFSFVVYTSLGFGDLTPVGDIRMMTALETLTGLVLIGWTASFLFVEMQHWAEQHEQ